MALSGWSYRWIEDVLFFFEDTATAEIYTLSLHDALPISDFLKVSRDEALRVQKDYYRRYGTTMRGMMAEHGMRPDDYLEFVRSEEHTSELQSQFHLVCRLLLEKKNNKSRHFLNYRPGTPS